MAMKHKNIYLYLALACFLGIILIFIFDGYMGVYDTLSTTSGEMPIKIEPDQWQQQGRIDFTPSTSVMYGGKVTFTYEVDNHWFAAYKADISVTVWQNQVKVADILTSKINVKAFGKEQTDWVLDTAEFASENLSTNTTNDFTVMIKRGDIERRVIVYVYLTTNQTKVIPIPPPPN